MEMVFALMVKLLIPSIRAEFCMVNVVVLMSTFLLRLISVLPLRTTDPAMISKSSASRTAPGWILNWLVTFQSTFCPFISDWVTATLFVTVKRRRFPLMRELFWRVRLLRFKARVRSETMRLWSATKLVEVIVEFLIFLNVEFLEIDASWNIQQVIALSPKNRVSYGQ